jgi:hypothetical protein
MIEKNKVKVSCEKVDVFCVYQHDNKQFVNRWLMAKKGDEVVFVLPVGNYDICGYRKDHKGSNVCHQEVVIKP